MSVGNFDRFSRLEVLSGIGRDLLSQFLASFQPDLAASPISAFHSLPDEAFFTAVAGLFSLSPSGVLPTSLVEALSEIEELSAPGIAEAHQRSLVDAGFKLEFPPDSSAEHKAFLLSLAVRDFLARLAADPFTFHGLVDEGPDSLDPTGIPEIRDVALEAVTLVSENAFHEARILSAADLFKSARSEPNTSPIPTDGTVVEAAFRFCFSYSPEPRHIVIRSPNILRLDHLCDVVPLARWMAQHHFTTRALCA